MAETHTSNATPSRRSTRRAMVVALCGLSVLMVSCSRESSAPGGGTDLRPFLPADTIGFATGNMQSPDLRNFMSSEGYRKYLSSMESQLQTSTPDGRSWAAYLATARAMGVLNTDTPPPFGSILWFATTGGGQGMPFATYYEVAKGHDGRKLLAAARSALTEKKIEFVPIQGDGFEGFSVDLIKEGDPVTPTTKIYLEVLKFTRVLVAANESRMAVATTRDLIDRAFQPPKNELAGFLNTPEYKKATEVLGASAGSVSTGAIDIAKVAQRFAPDGFDRNTLPIKLAVFDATASGDSLTGRIAGHVDAKTDMQKRVIEVFAQTSGTPFFSKLPRDTAFALTIDGPAVKKALEVAANESPRARMQAGMVLPLLNDVQSINIGISRPAAGAQYPGATLAVMSTNPGNLASSLQGLVAMGVPGGADAFQTETIGGLQVKSLPTPVGMKLSMATLGDSVLITNDQTVLTGLSKGTEALSQSAPVHAATSKMKKGLGGLFVDYKALAEMTQLSPAIAATQTEESRRGMEMLKNMGQIVVAANYDAGFANVVFTQHY